MDTLFRLVSFQQQQQQQQPPQHHHHHHLRRPRRRQHSDHSINHSNSLTNSSSTSSIRSSSHHNNNPNYISNYNSNNDDNNNNSNDNSNNYHYQQEECFNFFMDEEDFSSSSSHNKQFNQNINTNTNTNNNSYNYYHHQSTSQSVLVDPSSTTTSTPTDTPPPTSYHGGGGNNNCLFDFTNPSSYVGKWASNALLEAGRAVSVSDTARLHQLIWALNEVGSPYGDVEQKLASYFTQAIFTRVTDTGDTCHRNMRLAVDKTFSFESTRRMLLKFQEVSPWSTFGHVASNGALIDALEGESKLHIIDISNTFCTQWPTLLESLATRMDDTPHLKITTVLVNKYGGDHDDGGNVEGTGIQKVMKEIGARLEKFARLMGVPFKFSVVHHEGDISSLDFSVFDLGDDEALAINCVNSLHGVSFLRRDAVLTSLRRLNPRVVTVVEEEADIGDTVGPTSESYNSDSSGSHEFMRGFNECLRWFRVYFESLEETFPRASNEKLMLERAAGRALVDLLACPEAASAERRETAGRWAGRMGRAGLAHAGFSEEVCDDVRALLRRYKEGWSMTPCSGGGGGGGGGGGAGIFLCWKDQPVVWASAWKP
ncbi:hypothetical protein vseg_019449 [Gypsophila vaccaria]